MKLLVLYEELAVYFQACINRFAEQYSAEVLLVRRKVNDVAPFEFNLHPRISVVTREQLSADELSRRVREFAPDAILCGGWGYKPYLEICRSFYGKIPVVLGFDNWWEGTFRQRISAAAARFYFRKCFSACFVPGSPQKEFALHLGFPESQIRTGAYCCDSDFFRRVRVEKNSKGKLPRRFIFSGRYVPEKGVSELWTAFAELKNEVPNDWELWCLGKGDIVPPEIPGVKHFGFVQPAQITPYLLDTGVFILPSRFEPWGVVVHEFATAGFPLLLSDRVGAAEFFLRDGANGYRFPHGDKNALKAAMRRILELPEAELQQMGARSAELAEQHTPEKWSAALYGLIRER